MFNALSASIEFKQKRSVVFFMFGKRTTCVGYNMELTGFIGLAEDCAEAALVFVVAGRGVDDESVRPIFTRVIYNRFRTECGAKFVEGAKSSRR
jgi:hypothetical protein